MKLKDLQELISTNHFKVNVVDENIETLYGNLPREQDYDEYNVVGIDTTTEIGKESPITHTIDIRPILLITIKAE